MEKIKIKQAVVVEGRCDCAVLESVIDAVIIPVNGFGVYKDTAKLKMLRRYAETVGVILLTDSDGAGRQIRDYIKDRLNGLEVHHIYAPNLLEVEDTDAGVLRRKFEEFVKLAEGNQDQNLDRYDRQRLFDDGFIGGDGSAKRRRDLLRRLELPENLSVTALLDVLNKCGGSDYERIVKEL